MAGTPFPLFDWCNASLPSSSLQIRLYQSGPPFGEFPTQADFVEAAFPGYTPRTIAPPTTPQQIGSGYIYFNAGNMSFIFTNGAGNICTANGWYAVGEGGSADGLVACWSKISPGVLFTFPGDFVVIQPTWTVLKLITP